MKTTKKVAFLLLALYGVTRVSGQIPVKITVQTNLKDNLSQTNYDRINGEQITITEASLISNLGAVIPLKKGVSDRFKELYTFNGALALQSLKIQRFISGSQFNGTMGYNSYGYVKERYPIVQLTPQKIFRNKVIRMRYFKKLERERKRVLAYVRPENPIPEGERLLLMMTALEQVIDIVLENEEY